MTKDINYSIEEIGRTSKIILSLNSSSKIFIFNGEMGSGKTTLIKRLIPFLTDRGISVSTIKHAHHSFDIDEPGKDSFEHRLAGADEVLISSKNRWAIIHENKGFMEPGLSDLLSKLSPVNLVLVEGFKNTKFKT